MKLFHSRGFYLGNPVERKELPEQYEGKPLDELTVMATMTTKAEVENVIYYLQKHIECFKVIGDKEMFND